MTSIGSMIGELGLNNATFEAGFAQSEMTAARGSRNISNSAKQMAAKVAESNRTVANSQKTMESALKRLDREFAQLTHKVDPATKALREYERAQRLVKQAVLAGTTSQAEGSRVLALAKTRYEQAAAAATRFNAVSSRGAGSTRSYGNAIQQAGFQVGDFSVQLASGQGVLRPFIQQGTQLVSMFGPMGAVIGAVGASLGALATAFITSGDGADTFAEALINAQDEQAGLNAEMRKGIDLSQEQVGFTLRQAEAASSAARTQIEELQRTLDLRQQELAAQQELNRAGLGTGPGFFSPQKGAADEIKELTTKIEELQATVDIAEDNISTLRGEKDDLAAAGGRVARSIDNEIASNVRLVEALRVSEHQYEVTKVALSLLAREGFKGGEEQAFAFAASLIDARNAISDFQAAAKDAAASRAYLEGLHQQIAANDNLISALRVSDTEFQIVNQQLTIMKGAFSGTAAEARGLAETLVEQQAVMRDLRDTSNDLSEAVRTGNAIRAATRTNTEKMAIEQARLNKLLGLGVLSQEDFTRAMESARDRYRENSVLVDVLTKSTDTWIDGMVDGSFKAADALKVLTGELVKVALKWAALKALGADGSNLGGATNGLVSAVGSSFSGLLGLQNGLRFQVGQQGGTDSQVAAFKVSPNETVTVAKPGQSFGNTPEIHIDARGADLGVEQRLRAMIPEIVQASEASLVDRQSRGKLGRAFG